MKAENIISKWIQIIFPIVFWVTLSGCIYEATPIPDALTISPGETVTFQVKTRPANELVRWYLDDVEVKEGGKSFTWNHDPSDTAAEHVLQARIKYLPSLLDTVKNQKKWVISIPKRVPEIADISLKGIARTSATLNTVKLKFQCNPEASLKAYLGIAGVITAEGSEINDYMAGPFEASKTPVRFKDLDENISYTIYVVAKNTEGYSLKNLDFDLSQRIDVDPDDYLEMSEEELGHMIWFNKIADAELNDFSLIPSVNLYGLPNTGPAQIGGNSHRYQLAFSTYALALEQFHKVPIWKENIEYIIDRFIQKMLMKKVWSYWAGTSRGVVIVEPTPWWPTYPSEKDPVVKSNIMYSGHLAHMMTLYETLYDSDKWTGDTSKNGRIFTGEETIYKGEEPKRYTVDLEDRTFSFKWNEEIEFNYNLGSFLQCLYDQQVHSPQNCIPCEPNLCFIMCNTHHPLSFMLHDEKYGTDFQEAIASLEDWIFRTKQFDPVTHEMAHVYLVKQGLSLRNNEIDMGGILSIATVPFAKFNEAFSLVRLQSSSTFGWTGTFLHAFLPDLSERYYPHQKANRVVEIDENTAVIYNDVVYDTSATAFFAMSVAEHGDTCLRDRLCNSMVERWNPIWEEDGSFHFRNGLEYTINPFPDSNDSTCLTDKLDALARAIPANGVYEMHNMPFIGNKPNTPQVTNVDFPNVLLKRAIYDESKEAVIISTAHVKSKVNTVPQTRLNIENLDATRDWSLTIDGVNTDYSVQSNNGTKMKIEIEVLNPDDMHDIILQAE